MCATELLREVRCNTLRATGLLDAINLFSGAMEGRLVATEEYRQ